MARRDRLSVASDRSVPMFLNEIRKMPCQLRGPKSQEPLAGSDRRPWRKVRDGIRRKGQKVARCRKDIVEAMVEAMVHCGTQAAQRPQPTGWNIFDTSKARKLPASDHQPIALRLKRIRHMLDERLAPEHGQRLVAAKPRRLPAGQDHAEPPSRRRGQAPSSNSSRPIRKRRISDVPAPIS